MSSLIDRRRHRTTPPKPSAPADRAAAVAEFAAAMDEYKRRSGRMFPTWSEVLEVLRSLGYERPPQDRLAEQPAPVTEATDGGCRVAIAREGESAERIARSLSSCGGVEERSSRGRLFRFPAPRVRDAALDTVRRVFGWTAADPRR